MPSYEVQCEWTYYGTWYIEAESQDEARDIAIRRSGFPSGEYIPDSFVVTEVLDMDPEDPRL